MKNQFLQEKKRLPYLGVGLGYRPEIAEETLQHAETIDFLEVVTENYLNVGLEKLTEIEDAGDYQVIPHGVELSIGSTDALDYVYLKSVKNFLERIRAPWWSDHLSFTGTGGIQLNDLIPLPFSREAVKHLVKRINKVQEFIEVPFLLENISAYCRIPGAEMTEAQFFGEVLEQADCGMLLDVNNVYVNAQNHDFDPFQFIDQIPTERVVQIHIAGHKRKGQLVIDTHGAQIIQPVYDLLEHALKKTDVHGILLERDQYFPKFSSLLAELNRIKAIAQSVQSNVVQINQHQSRQPAKALAKPIKRQKRGAGLKHVSRYGGVVSSEAW